MQGITLIVLAAGIGKRFWPFTTSKALFPFFGQPIIEHVLSVIPKEISKIIVITNPHNDAVIRSIKYPVPASTVIQSDPNGMGDAMLACRDVISGPILVINVDDVIDPDLLSRVIKTDAYGAIPGIKLKGPFGYIQFDGDRPVGIVEKPKSGEEPSPYVNIVCHFISDGAELISEIARTKSTKDDVYEKALTALMRRRAFAFVPYDGPMAGLKYPYHVLDVMQILMNNTPSYKGKNVEIKSHVVIEGPVYIEDNVKIYEFTKIIGPCYIGKNTIIGNHTIIRQSHIGADSVIGFNSDVTRSYIGNNCWLHSNYVGDSVLEDNISMGGGTKLANLRLDEGEIKSSGRVKLGAMIARGVRIGVNASIMPGISIGRNSFIGAGVLVQDDVPDDSLFLLDSKPVMKKNTRQAPQSRDAFKKRI